MSRRIGVSVGLGATAWVGLLALATWSASRVAPGAAASVVSVLVYAVGALVCHQRPERSFHYLGAQIPVCARCAGIYAGAAVATWAALLLAHRRLAPPSTTAARLLVAACAMPTLLTLIAEWTTARTPSNAVRAVAGLPLGAAIAWVVDAINAPRISVEVD